MKNPFIKKLNKRFSEKQDDLFRQPGIMGNGFGGLLVNDLVNFVYVMVGDKAFPVYNNRVTPQYGLKVWVGYAPEEPTLFQVLATRGETPAGNEPTFTGYAPARRYEWNAPNGGQDPLKVHLRAFSPLRLGMSPNGGMNVDLYRGYVSNGTTHLSIPRQDIDLTSYIPGTANKAALVLITIDNTGSIVITDGADMDIDALAVTDLPDIPANTIFVCGAVRVYNGQTAVQEGRSNTDIVDLRFTGYAGAGFNLGSMIHAATSKSTPVDADELGIWDSVANALKKLTWANLKAALKTYFDTVYAAIADAYSDEKAQDAVGAMIADTSTIDLTYTDVTPELKADVKDASITYAKIQNVSATSRALGRKTAGAGSVEELTLSELLDFIGSAAQGDILYRGASSWARLAAGTSGKVLQTNGTGADPTWETPSSGGLTSSNISPTTTNTTAAVNYRYFADISGLTANRNFVVPAGAVGDVIELKIKTGDDTYAFIIIGDTGVSINGGSTATEWSRLFITGESIRLAADTTSNWQVISDKRIPCFAVMDRITSNANTSNSAGVTTTIDWNNVRTDNSTIADTTNDRFNIRRTGKYLATFTFRPANSVTDQKYIALFIIGAAQYGYVVNRVAATGAAVLANIPNCYVPATVGDTIYAKFATEEANIGMQRNDQSNIQGSSQFGIMEIFT